MAGKGFQKGGPNPAKGPNHKGRKKGTPNKFDAEAKELMQRLVLYGLENSKKWLRRTARANPVKALNVLAKVAEYAMPKLSKVDNTGEVGVKVLERRFYGAAPVKSAISPNPDVPALPAADEDEV